MKRDSFIYDTKETAAFKGLTIFAPNIEPGITFAEKNDVNALAIWESDDFSGKMIIDLDFLKRLKNVTTFELAISISPKSKIEGIYELHNLNSLRWSVGGKIELDFARLNKLESLNIAFSDGQSNWKYLNHLKELQICDIDINDLQFLSELNSLSYIRIIGGKISSLKGIEKCNALEYVFLQGCTSLVNIEDSISALPSLKGIVIERCRKVQISDNFKEKWDKGLCIF